MFLNQVFYTGQFSKFEELFLQNSRIERLKKNAPLFQEPKKEILHYVLEGIIMSYYLYENGEEKISGFFGKGQIVPYVACLPVEREYIRPKMYLPSRCLNPVTIATFDRETYMRLFDKTPELRTAVYNWLVYRHDKYEYETFFLANNTSFTKVCAFLYVNSDLFDAFGREGVYLTQNHIGSILGMNRIEVARAYKKLRDAGIITTSRGHVKLLSREKLKTLAGRLEIF